MLWNADAAIFHTDHNFVPMRQAENTDFATFVGILDRIADKIVKDLRDAFFVGGYFGEAVAKIND